MTEHLPWQAALWSQLSSRRNHAHAYLFHGPQGIGKRLLADRLKAFLLCAAPADGAACGRCKSCLLEMAGTHPDSIVVEPEEAEKPIRVDQIRELVHFVTQTAQLQRRKVILLEPVEAMNVNASNALLKSLEEPSGDTVLILISHHPSRLLPTVKSRCVQQACPLPNSADSLAWLRRTLPQRSVEDCQTLLALAGGSPLKAAALDAAGIQEQRERVVEGIKKLLKQQVGPSTLAEGWNSIALPVFMDWCCEWAQAALRYQLTLDEQELGLPDMSKVIRYLAERSSREQVMQLQEWLMEQRSKVLGKSNLNRVLLLESLLIRWASLSGAR